MNLKQIKYVITLADIGSFSEAAELLGISQPSLSQYIKKIETELGTELFERASGKVRLTDAGNVYLKTGKQMLRLQQNMENKLKDISEYKEGTILIGASPFRSITIMPPVTKKFQEKYPDIKLVIEELATKELQEAAERNEFDLCLTTLPVDESKLMYDVILEEEVGIAVTKGSELDLRLSQNISENGSIDVSLLNNEPFVMLPQHLAMQHELNTLCFQNNISLKKAAIVKSLGTQLEMVAAGVGSALVPMGIEKSTRAQRDIHFFSFLQKPPIRTLVIAYNKEKYLSQPMRDLIEIFKTV